MGLQNLQGHEIIYDLDRVLWHHVDGARSSHRFGDRHSEYPTTIALEKACSRPPSCSRLIIRILLTTAPDLVDWFQQEN